MRRLLVFLLVGISLSVCEHSFALDERDEGTYSVISNKDDTVTDKALKLLREGGEWHLKERLDNGQWIDSTCKGDCRLKESEEVDVFRFFSIAPQREQIASPSCVHNIAYAVCRFVRTNDQDTRYYVFVALEGKFLPTGLVRLKKSSKN